MTTVSGFNQTINCTHVLSNQLASFAQGMGSTEEGQPARSWGHAVWVYPVSLLVNMANLVLAPLMALVNFVAAAILALIGSCSKSCMEEAKQLFVEGVSWLTDTFVTSLVRISHPWMEQTEYVTGPLLRRLGEPDDTPPPPPPPPLIESEEAALLRITPELMERMYGEICSIAQDVNGRAKRGILEERFPRIGALILAHPQAETIISRLEATKGPQRNKLLATADLGTKWSTIINDDPTGRVLFDYLESVFGKNEQPITDFVDPETNKTTYINIVLLSDKLEPCLTSPCSEATREMLTGDTSPWLAFLETKRR